MAILTNPRHELFAQELAKGKSATESYILAGYRPSRKNAARLRAKDDIAARVMELQGIAARSAAITIESICRELDEANAVAKERGQASAMVSASALRAKLAGLMVEKVEVAGPGGFDDAKTTEDVVAIMIEGSQAEGYAFTEAEAAQLSKMMSQVMTFIQRHKTKPAYVIKGNSPADVRNRLINKPVRMSPVRVDNGSPRRLTNGNGSHR